MKDTKRRSIPGFPGIRLLSCLVMMALLLSACASDRKSQSTNADAELVSGNVTLPNDVFSTLALSGNSLVYLSMDESGQAGIRIYDLAGGSNRGLCTLDDYQMNPANNVVLENTLYLNYVTRDMQRKMLAVDMKAGTVETLLTESGISGMVYCATTSDAVYSLKHMTDGRSVVERFVPENRDFHSILEVGRDTPIHAISVYDNTVYLLASAADGTATISKLVEDTGSQTDYASIPLTQGMLEDSQTGYFQMLEQSFYLMNFSGQSELFDLEGTNNPSVSGWAIATNTAASMPHYILFHRFTAEMPVIVDAATGDLNVIQLEIPEGYSIRYAVSDLNAPARMMVVFVDDPRENQIAVVVSA